MARKHTIQISEDDRYMLKAIALLKRTSMMKVLQVALNEFRASYNTAPDMYPKEMFQVGNENHDRSDDNE